MKEYPLEKVEVWGNTLALFTKELEMADGRSRITLGRFLVEIPNSSCQEIRFFNLTQVAHGRRGGYSHPCVTQEHGQACWGDFGRVIERLYREGNLSLLVDTAFEYLETWSEEDPRIHPYKWEAHTDPLSGDEREDLITGRKKRALRGADEVPEVSESLELSGFWIGDGEILTVPSARTGPGRSPEGLSYAQNWQTVGTTWTEGANANMMTG